MKKAWYKHPSKNTIPLRFMLFPKLLLASKSPRRHEIFKLAGFDFDTIQIEADESYPNNLKGSEVCRFLSKHKSDHYKEEIGDYVLVTADTIVCIDDRVLNKPKDAKEAETMLHMLSNRTHIVHTGCTLRTDDKLHTFHESTEVTFKELSSIEIKEYIQNCQPFDKAGSYGIQDWMGVIGVKKINGCFYNVMGFPSAKFYRELSLFI